MSESEPEAALSQAFLLYRLVSDSGRCLEVSVLPIFYVHHQAVPSAWKMLRLAATETR